MKLGKKNVIALVAAGIFSVPMVASAAVKTSQVEADTVVITFEKADVMTPEGRATLEREVRTAAKLVCVNSDYSRDRSLRVLSETRSCYHSAVSGALKNIGSGELQISAR